MNISSNSYEDLANKEINWLPMDTEKLFLSNLADPSKRKLLETYNWIDTKFTYKFNSNGFRCQEFNGKRPIVFLGCSFVTGIGIPVESTWSYLVSERLGLPCYNLGIGGASNDTSFRMAYTWLEKLKPKIVVLCQTYPDRIELGKFGEVYKAGTSPQKFSDEWKAAAVNGQISKIKNTLAINYLCDKLNIKFIAVDGTEIPMVDLARDLMHPGVESNRLFSETVLSAIYGVFGRP